MEDFARGTVVGFAVSMTIPAMYYFNKAALGTLFAFNMEIGKALGRLILPPPPSPPSSPPPPPPPPPPPSPVFSFESTCNNKKCPIDGICPCDSYHCICYDCDAKKKLNPKYTSPCLTTSS